MNKRDSCIIMRNRYVMRFFTPLKYLILLQIKSYFSAPNNTRYLVPS